MVRSYYYVALTPVVFLGNPIVVIDGLQNSAAIEILSAVPTIICVNGHRGADAIEYDFNKGIVARYSGHVDTITVIGKSNNSSSFATGSSDGTVRIWDSRTKRSTAQLHFGHLVKQVTWDSANEYLLGFDYANRGVLWDLRTHRLLAEFRQQTNDIFSINSATLTTDAKKVILGYMMSEEALPAKVALYDISENNAPEVIMVNTHGADICEVKVNRTGRYLAIGDAGNNLYVVDRDRRNKISRLSHFFQSEGMQETCLAFDGGRGGSKYIAAGGFPDGEIGIWSLKNGRMHKFFKTQSRVTAIAWCESGKYLATVHADGKNRVWSS